MHERAVLTRLSLAADYYRNMRAQVGPEAAMTHTVQRYDVQPRDVIWMLNHEYVLSDAAVMA